MVTTRHTDRTVIVTGGASGIGRRICTRFATEGARIVVADIQREPRTGERVDADLTVPTDKVVTDEIGGEALYVETDVTDPDAAAEMVAKTVETYGGLDVLINNAGCWKPGGLADLDVETWQHVLETNLSGAFYCSRAARSHLIDSEGDILNISSHEADFGGTGPPYTSAKAGLNNLTRDMALELGPDGVNVNAVCPGAIRTPLTDYTETQLERRERIVPMGRVGEPKDVAALSAFLTSEEASFIQGECVFIDGGEVARFRSDTD